MTTPLKNLLKKDTFSWTQEETKYFEKLKEYMCTTSIIAMLEFTKRFTVECDAWRHGIGETLMQDGMPIPFQRHQLKGKYLHQFIKWKWCRTTCS